MNEKDILECFPMETFRPMQDRILLKVKEFLDRDDIKVLFLEAPTGSGKSPIADAIIEYMGNGYILTNTKQLQTQYVNTLGYVEMKGRNNFTCLINGDTCNKGACKIDDEFSCPHRPVTPDNKKVNNLAYISAKRGELYWQSDVKCPYWDAKAIAVNSPKVAHNYSYFETEANFVGDFGNRNVIIADEGHNLERKLLDFYSIKITKKQFESFSKVLSFQDYGKDIHKWYSWLRTLSKFIPDLIKEHDTKAKECHKSGLDSVAIFHRNEIENLDMLQLKLGMFFKEYERDKNNWISNVEYKYENNVEKPIAVEFKPIFIKHLADDLFFSYADKIVIMSATLADCKYLASCLGLKNVNEDYLILNTIPSLFPKENSPVYHLSAVKLNYKNLNKKNPDNRIDDLVNTIDQLLDIFSDEKGMLHTTTYQILNYIQERSRNKDRLLFQTPENRDEILKQHIESDEPTVIVSPSMTEGVDLEGELCAFQIMTKVPFKSLKDPFIIERSNVDNGKYHDTAICTDIIQTKGRGTRSKDDKCVNITIDNMFPYYCNKPDNGINEMLNKNFNSYIRYKKEFVNKYRNKLTQIHNEHPDEYADWYTAFL